MKLIPYKEALTMGKEALEAALAIPRAYKARKQAELEIATLDESIAVKEAAIQEACSSKDLSFNHIIELQDSLAITERRKKQFQKIVKEMFPKD